MHTLHPSLIKHRGRLPLSGNHLQKHPPAGSSIKVTLLQALLCKTTTSYLIPRTATSGLNKIDLKNDSERRGSSLLSHRHCLTPTSSMPRRRLSSVRVLDLVSSL